METLPLELAQEFIKDFFCIKHLFQFDWTTSKKYTDMDQDVYYGGVRYYAKGKGIRFDKLGSNVDVVTVTIDDVGYVIRDIILNEEIRGKVGQIYEVALNTSLQPLGLARRRFYGFCDAPERSVNSNDAIIKIVNHTSFWRRLTPRYVTSPNCQWTFKHGPDRVIGTGGGVYTCIGNQEHCGYTSNRPTTGANWASYWTLAGSGGVTWVEGNWYGPGTCRYSGGETWCDGSWTRCLALSNTNNFGGDRWIASLQDQKIWWGSPDNSNLRAYLMKK